MKKIFISFAMMCMAMVGYAATEDDGTYVGWPANYGGVMLQGFWWDSYDATQWTELTKRADELSQYFDLIWIPNAGTTSTGKYAIDHNLTIPNTMGYDPCYWLEYESCFGKETELDAMIAAYKAKNVGIIEDVVINHKNGVTGWCDFPQESKTGTHGTYTLTWDNNSYSGICKNDECNWAGYTTTGNYDTGDNFDGYRDLDHTNSQVQANVKTYLNYLLKEKDFAGFRYDMVKGYGAGYINTYNNDAKPMFSVGEYWSDQTSTQNWISNTAYTSAAFDFPLKYKLNTAISGGDYSALDWKSFTFDPNFSQYSVTFADNHDTGRNDDMLKYNWTAANAFILASPGTPCVWFKHYEADPTNIGAMIQARKACGITNTGCTVLTQQSTENNSGYILETQGTNGKVYVQLGAAADDGTPSGYTLIASGDSYKFYADYNEPAVAISPNGGTIYSETSVTITPNASALQGSTAPWYKIGDGDQVTLTGATTITVTATTTISWGAYDSDGTAYTGEATFTLGEATTETVYLNNNAGWSTIYCYAWNSAGEILGTWPGTEVNAGTDGKYTQTFTGVYPAYVIWNNGNSGDGNQTEDLAYVAGTTYSNGTVSATSTVYLNNTAGWSTIYCYAWNADGALLGSWPGTKITTTNSSGYYEAGIDGTPTGIIWNDGNGVQTDDLTFTNGSTYTNGQIIYLDNTANWEKVYCHYWGGSSSTNWPGVEVTRKNADGLYYKIFTDDTAPNGHIWNGGSDAQKSGDLTFANGALYINGSSVAISTVKYASNVDSWVSQNSFNKGGNYSWYYTLDLSNNTEDVLFKVIVNDNSWLGYNNVSISAPDGWIESSDDGLGGQNIKLNNSTAGYKTYQITATYASTGWTIEVNGLEERADTWTIAGMSDLTGSYWDPTDTSNDMTSSDGTNYTLTKSNVSLTAGATYEYKVVRNHDWSSGSYGKDCANDNNQTLSVTQSGLYTVTFSFNSSTYALSATATMDTYNINGTSYGVTPTCNVALTDGMTTDYYFSSDVASFTAATASYSRSSSYQWGTLCLPFEIKNTYDGVTFYQLSRVDLDNNVLNFDPVSGTISAGTPIVYKVATADSEGKYNLSISESSVTVVNAPVTGAAVDGWTLEGTFSRLTGLTATTDDGNKQYYIAKNKFWNEDFNVSAYRGWFIATEAAASNAPFRISGGDADGIQYVEQEDGSVKVYYDLQGRKTNADRKGLVIENGKVFFVK